MRSSLPSLLLCLLASAASAHPGSGIVADQSGNVFFVVFGSNVVMKLSPDGQATPYVTDERLRLPHHLVLGGDGTLYVASDHDGKVWRVGTDSRMREYFNSNRVPAPPHGRQLLQVGAYGDPFTIDRNGNVYALASPSDVAVVRITPDGIVTPLATHARFGDLHFRSMAWGADGALYLTDENRVWRIVGDSATAIVPRGVQLSQPTGLAVDGGGNIYVADFTAGRVVRLGPDGAVNTPPDVARLRVRNPVGLTLAGGALYVLDSPPGGVAVWRVREGERQRLYSKRSAQFYARWVFVGLLVALLVLVVLRAYERVRRGGHHQARHEQPNRNSDQRVDRDFLRARLFGLSGREQDERDDERDAAGGGHPIGRDHRQGRGNSHRDRGDPKNRFDRPARSGFLRSLGFHDSSSWAACWGARGRRACGSLSNEVDGVHLSDGVDAGGLRCLVACSYAYAILINVASLHARPRTVMPAGSVPRV